VDAGRKRFRQKTAPTAAARRKTFEVYNVLAKGTIDERMLELLAQKEQIIAQAVDGKKYR